MEVRVLDKSRLAPLLDAVIGDMSVIGVKEKHGKYVYGPLRRGTEFCPDFDVTVQSPKQFILPARETMLDFTLGDQPVVTPHHDTTPCIIWGVHPYDIKAINLLDKTFRETSHDRHYLDRRAATMIVGIDPVRASEKAFWGSMRAATVEHGFDLLLTDLGDEFAVAVGSERGGELLNRYGATEQASDDQLAVRDAVRAHQGDLCHPNRRLHFSLDLLPSLLQEGVDADLWKEESEKCFSCGSCNLVCPTCYCFDVRDEVDSGLTKGRRLRVWDGCMLHDFAAVATGENFREHRYQRYRHRFYRKGLYVKDRYGEFACVGCGRCASACLPDITDPVKVYNKLHQSLRGVTHHEA